MFKTHLWVSLFCYHSLSVRTVHKTQPTTPNIVITHVRYHYVHTAHSLSRKSIFLPVRSACVLSSTCTKEEVTLGRSIRPDLSLSRTLFLTCTGVGVCAGVSGTPAYINRLILAVFSTQTSHNGISWYGGGGRWNCMHENKVYKVSERFVCMCVKGDGGCITVSFWFSWLSFKGGLPKVLKCCSYLVT